MRYVALTIDNTMIVRVTPKLNGETHLAQDAELEKALKYLLIAEGSLVRAQCVLGEPPPEPGVMESLQAAWAAIRDAELKLWPHCDPWARVQEGVW